MSVCAEDLRCWLANVIILPRRIVISEPVEELAPAVLRGLWGAALHAENIEVYRTVFAPGVEDFTNPDAVPGYLIRSDDQRSHDKFEWILFGRALEYDPVLCRAWQTAGRMGIGKHRAKFQVIAGLVLGPDGRAVTDGRPWALDQCVWPLDGDPATTPCRIVFEAPLRILGEGKRLIQQPQLSDVIASVLRRVRPYLRPGTEPPCPNFFRGVLDSVPAHPCGPWQGGNGRLQRWSARQQTEVRLHGVVGGFVLPEGPGPFWPLLAAAQWLHVGKGTVYGLGRLRVRPL